jgi:predicted AAA+ superfamily ATPase
MATKIRLMAQELARQNSWWRDKSWASTDPDLTESAASGLNYRTRVLDQLEPGCLYLLRGPRRAGKTVAVKQQIESLIGAGTPPQCIIRVDVDGWSDKDIRTVVQNTSLPPVPTGHQRIWFFDEISSVSGNWDQHIRWLRGNDPDFRASVVVLTGSNASALTAAAGTLAGRRGGGSNLDRALFPMGFATFVSLVGKGVTPPESSIETSDLHSAKGRDIYNGLVPWLDDLVRLWELYLNYGGFPRSVAAAASGLPIPQPFVDDLFNVISGDAFKNSRLSTSAEMALIERLWSSMASPANLTEVGRDIDVSHELVRRHVSYLEDSYLLWRCPQRQDDQWLPRDKAQDKIYAIDPIVARLAHLRNPARVDIDPTVLTEMQIGMALRRSIVRADPTALNDEFLFYERTPTRKEIDFVARALSGAAVEGKYVEDGKWHGEVVTVNASAWKGILATRNVLDMDTDPSWAVPASFLAYSLDT